MPEEVGNLLIVRVVDEVADVVAPVDESPVSAIDERYCARARHDVPSRPFDMCLPPQEARIYPFQGRAQDSQKRFIAARPFRRTLILKIAIVGAGVAGCCPC